MSSLCYYYLMDTRCVACMLLKITDVQASSDSSSVVNAGRSPAIDRGSGEGGCNDSAERDSAANGFFASNFDVFQEMKAVIGIQQHRDKACQGKAQNKCVSECFHAVYMYEMTVFERLWGG